ncbi:MAG: class I SAM-dependent methyltransferase [Dehalococcoidia bacterium]
MPPIRSRVEVGAGLARYYDLLLSVLSAGYYPYLIRRVIRKMNIQPGQSILDLGSGTGSNDCLMVAKVGRRGRIVGLDISDEMLAQARKRCHTHTNTSFEKQRIELPLGHLGEHKFDKVFICFALHGFENDQKLGIIHNAYEALKPGGAFYIMDYNEFDFGKVWFPIRWIFSHLECELAVEFLNLDIKGMLQSRGFTDFEEELLFMRYFRLLRAVKPLISSSP